MTPETQRRDGARSSSAGDHGPSLRAIPFGPRATREVVQLLSKRQQQQLAGIATRLRLPARMVLYREESLADWIFIVAHGVMKSFRDLPSGKRRVMAFLFPDDIFGLAESGHYVNTTQSVTPVTLYRLEMGTLTAMLRRDSELEFQFLCKVTHELRESLHQTVVVGRRDAVGRLAMFLRMLEQETRQRGRASHIEIPMSRSDTANYLGLSLEAVSRANDLRVLLAAMVTCVDSIRAKVPQGLNVDRDFAAFDSAIDNAFYVSRELIAVGAPKTSEPGVIDVNELVLQVRGILERILGPSIRLSFSLAATSPIVQADAVQLEWVLLNLAANGRDAMPDGGTLTIETTSIDAAPQDIRATSRHRRYIRLTVRDTGETKKGGTGLGLTGVAITSRLLNGSLHVHSNEPHGTAVHIYLPVVIRNA